MQIGMQDFEDIVNWNVQLPHGPGRYEYLDEFSVHLYMTMGINQRSLLDLQHLQDAKQ